MAVTCPCQSMPAVMIHDMRWKQKNDSDKPILGPSHTTQHHPRDTLPPGRSGGRTDRPNHAAAISSAQGRRNAGEFLAGVVMAMGDVDGGFQ